MMEQTTISISNQCIEGKTYTGDLSARLLHSDGKPYHTFRTYSVLIDGSDLTFRDCTFINDAGKGKDVGQAIACYVDGDNISFVNCRFIGHQDTLFLAPLPEKEREADGFLGPKQFEPRIQRTVHFKDCYIEGGVDFVFGGAAAFFDHCEFCSNEVGYIFAANTPKGAEHGFAAEHCRFTCKDDVPDGSCYIGRPWRDDAKVSIHDCELGRHIARNGWIGWNQERPADTTTFVETGSYGPGARKDRPVWVRTK